MSATVLLCAVLQHTVAVVECRVGAAAAPQPCMPDCLFAAAVSTPAAAAAAAGDATAAFLFIF